MANYRRLAAAAQRSYVVVLQKGDSAVDELTRFAERERLKTTALTAIGGFAQATLAYFDIESQEYLDIPVAEQTEVLALTGDIVQSDDGWQLHAHAVLGRRDGSTVGGHLRTGVVRPTLEVMLTESPPELRRKYDESAGLALIDLAK